MISSVSLLEEASHTVRLAPGCDEDGSRKGNSAAPAVAIVSAGTPAENRKLAAGRLRQARHHGHEQGAKRQQPEQGWFS
jgi:hypothetical protein